MGGIVAMSLAAAGGASASEAGSSVVLVEEMTGAGAVTDTAAQWQVEGTDLGIMWDDGHGGVLTAFGDTFGDWAGDGGGGQDWRSNVLLRSTDADLTDGMSFDWALEDAPGTPGRSSARRRCLARSTPPSPPPGSRSRDASTCPTCRCGSGASRASGGQTSPSWSTPTTAGRPGAATGCPGGRTMRTGPARSRCMPSSATTATCTSSARRTAGSGPPTRLNSSH